MKTLHIKIDDDLHKQFISIMSFHGGKSVGVRIALKNFIRDVESGKLKLTGETFEDIEKAPIVKEGELKDILGGNLDDGDTEQATSIPTNEKGKS